MTQCTIYLVPGFFGFASLGALNYFFRVGESLHRALRQAGVDARIVECTTLPTGSLTYRADRLLQHVLDTDGLKARRLHFVGHSTGGLDSRLLVSPGVRLRPGSVEAQIAEKTGMVITLATPHFGTPLASFFASAQGRVLLQLLSSLASTESGRMSVFLVSQLLQFFARIDDRFGRDDTLLDALSARLLKFVSLNPADPIWHFMNEVASDQGAIVQLTPESMNLFNAAVADHPEVAYRSLVAAAPPPTAARLVARSAPRDLVFYALFALLYGITCREHAAYRYPSPATTDVEALRAVFPFAITSRSNDGVVPSLSQLYGEPLLGVVADHLDLVGQFRNAGGQRLSDWLPSGSNFDESRFQSIWGRIATEIAAAGGRRFG